MSKPSKQIKRDRDPEDDGKDHDDPEASMRKPKKSKTEGKSRPSQRGGGPKYVFDEKDVTILKGAIATHGRAWAQIKKNFFADCVPAVSAKDIANFVNGHNDLSILSEKNHKELKTAAKTHFDNQVAAEKNALVPFQPTPPVPLANPPSHPHPGFLVPSTNYYPTQIGGSWCFTAEWIPPEPFKITLPNYYVFLIRYNYAVSIDIEELDEANSTIVLIYREMSLMEDEVKMTWAYRELDADLRDFPSEPTSWKQALRLPSDCMWDEDSIGRQDHECPTGGLFELCVARKKQISLSRLAAPRFAHITTQVKTPVKAPKRIHDEADTKVEEQSSDEEMKGDSSD